MESRGRAIHRAARRTHRHSRRRQRRRGRGRHGRGTRDHGRVHVAREEGRAVERDTGSDVAAAAAESLRLLRRHAVVAVPLKSEQVTGIVHSSAFLIDKELWDEFVAAVDDQRKRNPRLTLELTGPWPPFDFVRMQFGS